jgi:hypothetical protein
LGGFSFSRPSSSDLFPFQKFENPFKSKTGTRCSTRARGRERERERKKERESLRSSGATGSDREEREKTFFLIIFSR